MVCVCVCVCPHDHFIAPPPTAIVVGFSELTYRFSEGVGSGRVCVDVTDPAQGVPDGISFNILFSTSPGSAGATPIATPTSSY